MATRCSSLPRTQSTLRPVINPCPGKQSSWRFWIRRWRFQLGILIQAGVHGSIPVKSFKKNIEVIGNRLETVHLRSYSQNVAQKAFDLKKKMIAYL
ncbi:unnamed protein product [Cuscuta campestris]|uniref:Uncharacterized protein n=1 Tax=Cuscuta campestris TaxID=132261 RepID=A0A484LLK5_9ASTE|nr:unnamed protein product [Cuscuta campestris]